MLSDDSSPPHQPVGQRDQMLASLEYRQHAVERLANGSAGKVLHDESGWWLGEARLRQ